MRGEVPPRDACEYMKTQLAITKLSLASMGSHRSRVEVETKPPGVFALQDITTDHPLTYVPDANLLSTCKAAGAGADQRREFEYPTKVVLKLGMNMYVDLRGPRQEIQKGKADVKEGKIAQSYLNMFAAIRKSTILDTCNMRVVYASDNKGKTLVPAIPVMKPMTEPEKPIKAGEELVCYLDEAFFHVPAKKTKQCYSGPSMTQQTKRIKLE
jgi:hypothetical protein